MELLLQLQCWLDVVNIWAVGSSRIPTLALKDPITKFVTRIADDNISKRKMFYEISFLSKPDLAPLPKDFHYPLPRWIIKNITDEQIHSAIIKLKPYIQNKPIDTQALTGSNIFLKKRLWLQVTVGKCKWVQTLYRQLHYFF